MDDLGVHAPTSDATIALATRMNSRSHAGLVAMVVGKKTTGPDVMKKPSRSA
jgi:hypothetical protein